MFAICLKVSYLYPMSQLILQYCAVPGELENLYLYQSGCLVLCHQQTNNQSISPVLSEFVERDEKDGLIMKM